MHGGKCGENPGGIRNLADFHENGIRTGLKKPGVRYEIVIMVRRYDSGNLHRVFCVNRVLLYDDLYINFWIAKRIPEPFGEILKVCNPVAFLIASMRDALLYGQAPSWELLLLWGFISLILIALGHLQYIVMRMHM